MLAIPSVKTLLTVNTVSDQKTFSSSVVSGLPVKGLYGHFMFNKSCQFLSVTFTLCDSDNYLIVYFTCPFLFMGKHREIGRNWILREKRRARKKSQRKISDC